MILPEDGITLADYRSLTDALLRSGADITRINTIRKHVEQVKGGRLAQVASPATVLSLVLSDVVGNPLDFIASGPTVPDNTTFNDAMQHFSIQHLVELTALIGTYAQNVFFLNAFGVELPADSTEPKLPVGLDLEEEY